MKLHAPADVLGNDELYRGYASLHRKGTIAPAELDSVLVFGHAAVGAVLKDARFEMRPPYPHLFPKDGQTINLWAVAMNSSNGADHARRRAFMARAFQPKVLAGFVPRMEALLDETFRGFGRRKNVDIVQELASPFPVRVIGEILGVPRDAHPQCVIWSEIIAPFTDPTLASERIPGIAVAGTEFVAFIRALMDDRRKKPGPDILSQLTQQLDAHGDITEDEVIANIIALFLAGHETTTSLISSTLIVLQQHPEARAELDAKPELLPTAIEEVLRYESPIQFASRAVTEDAVIDGTKIPKHITALVLIGAANRDPRIFEAPDRFDIHRSPNPHVAFGAGLHACIGAALARLEGKHALQRFFTKFPRWSVDEQACVRRETVALRSWKRAPMKLR